MVVGWAVQAAKLIAAENEIMQAVQAYREAVKQAKMAGDALAADWAGDAREVFVQEQEKAYNWHISISDIVSVFASTMQETAKKYEEAEKAVSQVIKQR